MGSSLVQRWIRRIVSQTFSINPDCFSVQTSTYSEKEVDVIISKIHNMIWSTLTFLASIHIFTAVKKEITLPLAAHKQGGSN